MDNVFLVENYMHACSARIRPKPKVSVLPSSFSCGTILHYTWLQEIQKPHYLGLQVFGNRVYNHMKLSQMTYKMISCVLQVPGRGTD